MLFCHYSIDLKRNEMVWMGREEERIVKRGWFVQRFKMENFFSLAFIILVCLSCGRAGCTNLIGANLCVCANRSMECVCVCVHVNLNERKIDVFQNITILYNGPQAIDFR